MTCASCVRRAEQAIAAVPGVTKATVNLATERATVEAAGEVPLTGIEAAVRKAGYEPRRIATGVAAADTRQKARDRKLRNLRRDFAIAAALTLPVFLLEMGSHLVPSLHHWLLMNVGQQPLYLAFFVLATAVQFGPGLRFYRKGVPALLRLAPDMNSLVVLGSTAAWAYSVVAPSRPRRCPTGPPTSTTRHRP